MKKIVFLLILFTPFIAQAKREYFSKIKVSCYTHDEAFKKIPGQTRVCVKYSRPRGGFGYSPKKCIQYANKTIYNEKLIVPAGYFFQFRDKKDYCYAYLVR